MNPDDIRLLEDLFVRECPVPPSGQPWVALFQRKDHLECYVFDGQAGQRFPDTKVATLSHDGRTITWGRNKTEKYRGREWPQLAQDRLEEMVVAHVEHNQQDITRDAAKRLEGAVRREWAWTLGWKENPQ